MSEEAKKVEEVKNVDVIDDMFGGDESLPAETEDNPQDDNPTNLPEDNPDSGKEDGKGGNDADPEKIVIDPPQTEDEPKGDTHPAKEEDNPLQQKIHELETKLEASDKRVRDNQTSYHQEHSIRLELEKELAELKKKNDTDDGFGFLDDDEDDPDKKKGQKIDVEKIKKDVANEVSQQVSQSLSEQRWNEAEEKARSTHGDYDDVIDKYLLPELEGNAPLAAKFREMGGNPEAAYKLGQMIKTRQEFESDPDAYLERRIAEKQTKNNTPEKKTEEEPKKQKASGLTRNSSSVPVEKGKNKDVLDELFPD